jgi:hypothetical protein
LCQPPRLEFEQTRVNEEVWLPQILRASGAVRIVLRNQSDESSCTEPSAERIKTNMTPGIAKG